MSGAVELSTPIGKVRSAEFEPGLTINELIVAHEIPADRQPVVCVVNGQPVLRKDWDVPMTGHDQIQFIALPMGGKGGGGMKGILRLVALIALAVVAPWAAGVIGGAIGVTSAVGIGLIQAGIMVAGAFLINALLSPKPPSAKSSGGSDSETSPTYSLAAQGNTARLMQPIPRLYGRHVIYPDFASSPFADYANNEQYLYQLFCLGVGRYQVEQVRIEETALWLAEGGYTNNFDDVQIEIVEPGQSVTLVPLEIETSSQVGNQDLKNLTLSGSFTFSGNTITGSAGVFANVVPGDVIIISGGSVNNNGSRTVATRAVGNGALTVNGSAFVAETSTKTIALDDWVGPYVAVSANKITDALAVDFVFSQGIGYANDDGGISNHTISIEVQARPINASNVPTGGWVVLGQHTYTRRTSTPQRVTERYDVTVGRYEVRARRTTARQFGTRYLDNAQWGGLRAYIPDDSTYEDVTLLAVKMRATDQLTQQSARKFNVIMTALVPTWDGTSWSEPVPTRSIAWAAADVLRNTIYGGSTPDSRIDLEKLRALDETWQSRGDHFDGVFDSKRSLWDAVSTVVRAGRAQPVMVAGVVTFVRDEPRSIARGVFTPRNIVRNSFEATHILYDEDSPDDVIVEYLDQRTWKPSEVQCTLPGSLSEAPARIQLFGVVDRSQAWREGMYQAAANAYRRKIARLTSELDGRVLIKGDPIVVSHDVPAWSQSGEVIDRDGLTIFVSEPPAFVEGENNYILIRRPNGREFPPVICHPHSEFTDAVVLDGPDLNFVQESSGVSLDEALGGLSDDRDPPLYVFMAGQTDVARFLLTTGSPRGLSQVELAMVNDDPRVYEADQGVPPAEASPLGPGSVPGAPIAQSLSVMQDPNSAASPVTVNASWPAAPGAQTYTLQVSYDNVSWLTAYSGAGTAVQITIQPGLVYFRLAGVNTFRGPWVFFSSAFGTATAEPSTPADLSSWASPSEGTVDISWSPAARAQSYRVEIYVETVVGSGTYNILKFTRETPAVAMQLTSADITAAGGPWSSYQVRVYSINASGTSLPASYTVGGYTLATPTGLSLVTAYVGADIQAQWAAVTNATSYEVQLVARGAVIANLAVTSPSVLVSASALESYGGPFRRVDVRVRARANALSSSEALVTAAISGVTDMWDFESVGTATIGSNNISFQDGSSAVDAGSAERSKAYQGTGGSSAGTTAATIADSYTKAAWVRPVDLTGEKHVLSSTGSAPANAHSLRLLGSVLQAGQGSDPAAVVAPALAAAGVWRHVAVTYDAPSTTMKLYVDGALVATNASVSALTTGQGVKVGNAANNAAGWVGLIDEVQIYNRALSATEVAALKR